MSSTLVQSTSQSSSYKNTLGASYRQISHTFLPFSGFVLGRSWEEWPLPVRSIANLLKFSNSLKRKYIHRRGPFLQNLFVNPIAVFEWFECGCRNLCGKISTCLGYFRVIILCLGFASPLHDITESSLRLYVKFGEVFERKISSAKNVEPAIYFHLALRWQCALVFPFIPAAACCCSLVPVQQYFKLTVSQISIFPRHVSFYRTRNWPCTAFNFYTFLLWRLWLHHRQPSFQPHDQKPNSHFSS